MSEPNPTQPDPLEKFKELAKQYNAGQYSSQPSNGACPHCGYCRHCGRGGHTFVPSYPSPYLPIFPPSYPTYPTFTIQPQGGLS